MALRKYTKEQEDLIVQLRLNQPNLTRYEIAEKSGTSLQFVKRFLNTHPQLLLSVKQRQVNAQKGRNSASEELIKTRNEFAIAKTKRNIVTIQDCIDLATKNGGKCLSTSYARSTDKYLWECKEGHAWYATHNSILNGKWCGVCSGNVRKDIGWLHELAAKNNGTCLSTEYINNSTNYKWKCSIGDVWETAAANIANGTWCPYCSGHLVRINHLQNLAQSKGGECLDGEFVYAKTHYKWKCKEGHIWYADANHIQQGTWCPQCRAHVSTGHQEIIDFIKSLGLIENVDFIVNDRTVIKPKELDIYFPKLRLGMEYDGLYYHSEWNPHYIPNTRLPKYQECSKQEIRFFSVFEDEWRNKPALIKAMIKWRLKLFDGTKLRGQDLEIKKLEHNWMFKDFFDKNHIDGHKKSSYAYGLFSNDKLVSCLSIARNRNSELEISRFATDYDHLVYGAFKILLNQVIKEINEPLTTFSNNRIGTGEVYKNNGFILIADNGPNYWYTDGEIRIDRSRCMRNNNPEILARFPTEKLQAQNGVFSQEVFGDSRPIFRIEDYGHKKWKLEQNNE